MPSWVPEKSWPDLLHKRLWVAQMTIRSELEADQQVPEFQLVSANSALPPLNLAPLPQGVVRVVIYTDYNTQGKLICVYPAPYIAA
ncbi:hypothetical protein SORBI_3005G156850 [Sorghum bicolor]|uniref:Uncharacterized protein n=1 Tax=Sorghum bicolor TaxID=4558 RepID=A0A1Z5RIV0_SORBI|nr:hypothetical protein SORBI_3005G156850 [Sorghum bicolor]